MTTHPTFIGYLARSLAGLPLPFLIATASPAWSDEFVEDNAFFRVTIGGRTVRLEGLTVKRADATGRLPVALITHGKPANLQNMLDDRATAYVGQARDLASRGWLAVVAIRRGFGQSDGPMPSPVSCRSTSFLDRFSADADDLQAVLDLVAQRPDADAARMIAIGVSAGGAAVMALSARNPKNLLGVINVSGGLRMQACPKEDALVEAFKDYGKKSRVPGLWMYAKNDSFFGPNVVERMRNGFLDAGGDVKLVMFDPIGEDGHRLFSLGSGRLKWLQEMDGFLRSRKLPTWERQDVTALMTKLKAQERSRGFVEGFVAGPLEKALAKTPSGYMHGGWGNKTVDDARNTALNGCKKEKPQEQCAIVMENNRWVGGEK
jgi:dienelactone hydrolase